MSENLRRYQRAAYVFDAVTRRVPDAAWENQSPCEEWTAREVVGHVSWGPTMLAASASGAGTPADMTEAQRAGDDPVASWAASLETGLAALDQPGSLQTVAETPFGAMPIDDMLGFFFADPVMHAWDLAQAAGIDHAIPEDLADASRALWEKAGDMLRRPGALGPAVDAPEGADAATRMAACGGRTVS